jgi:hypothetical protein
MSFLFSSNPEQRARELAERKQAAFEALPARTDWASLAGFSPAILSQMAACLYAAGRRESAWEALEWCDGHASAQTCDGQESALSLAARAGDFAFIERAELLAARRLPKDIESGVAYGKPPTDEAEALERVRRRFWTTHAWSRLILNAVAQEPGPSRDAATAFWRDRFFIETDFNGKPAEPFTKSGWDELRKKAIELRDVDALGWMLRQEAAFRNERGEPFSSALGSRDKVFTESWREGWALEALNVLPMALFWSPRDLDVFGHDTIMAGKQPDSIAFARQAQWLAERVSPSPERLSSWINQLADASFMAPGDAALEERALGNLRALLALGADPTLPARTLSSWGRGDDSSLGGPESAPLVKIASALLEAASQNSRMTESRRHFLRREAIELARAQRLEQVDEKFAFRQTIGGEARRKASVLGLALLAGEFELAEALALRGADWRSAKNLFEAKNAAQEHPEANAFFESMQLSETARRGAQKTRRRLAKEESAPQDSAPAPEPAARPSRRL